MSGLTRHLMLVASLACAPLAASALAAPPIVGFCAVCHGETGPSEYPGVPTIHGLPAGVIENALYKYRERERPCRVTECSKLGTCPDISMCDIVGSMDDEDLAALADWYGAQPFPAHQDPYDAELAARGRRIHDQHCEICHTNLGSDPVDDASMLRGQRKVYLRNALEDLQEGRRSVGLAAMEDVIKGLSRDDLAALAEFYSGPAVYTDSR
ncbi:MAG: c-type cytochrome [Gammaproteobacteria bacterium]